MKFERWWNNDKLICVHSINATLTPKEAREKAAELIRLADEIEAEQR